MWELLPKRKAAKPDVLAISPPKALNEDPAPAIPAFWKSWNVFASMCHMVLRSSFVAMRMPE